MIDVLIFALLILVVILIAIKYGALPVLATVLAVLALIPFIISAYLYISQKPTIKATIYSKEKYKVEDRYVYAFHVGIQCDKGDIILENFYLQPEWEFLPTNEKPSENNFSTKYSNMKHIGRLDENETINVFKLETEATLFTKNGFDNSIGLESEKEQDKLKIKLTIDTSIDPFKQKWLSIFPSIYSYRQRSEVMVDFAKASNDYGIFK